MKKGRFVGTMCFILVALIVGTIGTAFAARAVLNYNFALKGTTDDYRKLSGPAQKIRPASSLAQVICTSFNGQQTVNYQIWTGDDHDAVSVSSVTWLKTGRSYMSYNSGVQNLNYIPLYLGGRVNTLESPSADPIAIGTWSPDDY